MGGLKGNSSGIISKGEKFQVLFGPEKERFSYSPMYLNQFSILRVDIYSTFVSYLEEVPEHRDCFTF